MKTDGKKLYYSPVYIIKAYKKDRFLPKRLYLHSLLHCILCHCFTGEKTDILRWNTACDISVENIIDELGVKGTAPGERAERENISLSLKRKIKVLTAEKIYRYFYESGMSDMDVGTLGRVFTADDHSMWYRDNKSGMPGEKKGWQKNNIPGQNTDSDKGMNGKSGRQGKSQSGTGDRESEGSTGESRNGNGNPRSMSSSKDEKKEWKRIARSAEKEIRLFSKNPGNAPGSLILSLDETIHEKNDYGDFLRKFSVRSEAVKQSTEEFDYIYYTYGLNLFKNLPLIEPLEYSDDKKIRDFVIVLDTSGSCSGKLVRQFIKKTCSILFEQEYFFKRINVHIIQCDSKVQHDDVIRSSAELLKFAENIKIYGGGGTDFRPAFRYVDNLVKENSFTNLKGLIYFTDGIGIYPEKKPEYSTAFVFVDDGEKKNVPAWAAKTVLESFNQEGDSDN